MHSDIGQRLFQNLPDREMTFDQRNICVWSRMYDNVQESHECPSEDVLNDDDLLDGWFIIQRKKQEHDKLVSEVEGMTNNEKIANSEEIFIFTNNREEAERINDANTVHGKMLKQDRMQQIKRAGSLNDHELQDKRLQLQRMSNTQFKEKFRGKNGRFQQLIRNQTEYKAQREENTEATLSSDCPKSSRKKSKQR